MKKDRNTFFQESGFYSQNTMPNPMIANQPSMMTNAQAQQSFYAGPMPNNYTMPQQNMPAFVNQTTDTSDIESRLSKIERNISRLDARLTKLENQNLYSIDEIDNSTNMYMV